jgi:hypothetical protein
MFCTNYETTKSVVVMTTDKKIKLIYTLYLTNPPIASVRFPACSYAKTPRTNAMIPAITRIANAK